MITVVNNPLWVPASAESVHEKQRIRRLRARVFDQFTTSPAFRHHGHHGTVASLPWIFMQTVAYPDCALMHADRVEVLRRRRAT